MILNNLLRGSSIEKGGFYEIHKMDDSFPDHSKYVSQRGYIRDSALSAGLSVRNYG